MEKRIYQSPYIEVVLEMTECILTTPSVTDQDHDADAKEQSAFEEKETMPVSPNVWGEEEE